MLEGLRAGRVEFLAWQSACSKSEQLGTIVAAYQYWQALKRLASGEDDVEGAEERIVELAEEHTNFKVRAVPLHGPHNAIRASLSDHRLAGLCIAVHSLR